MNLLNPRIVLDTNVFLVSLARGYKYHWIFESLLKGHFQLCLSTEILFEYQEIISTRYGLSKTDATLDFLILLPNVYLITPYFKWRMINTDEDDNKIIDCAVASNADFIVSNDKHLKTIPKNTFIRELQVFRYEEFEEQYKNQFLSI